MRKSEHLSSRQDADDVAVYHRFVLCVVITGIGQGDRLI
jgi:hypothetical protein